MKCKSKYILEGEAAAAGFLLKIERWSAAAFLIQKAAALPLFAGDEKKFWATSK